MRHFLLFFIDYVLQRAMFIRHVFLIGFELNLVNVCMYESKIKTLLLAHPSFKIKLSKGIRGIWIVGTFEAMMFFDEF